MTSFKQLRCAKAVGNEDITSDNQEKVGEVLLVVCIVGVVAEGLKFQKWDSEAQGSSRTVQF